MRTRLALPAMNGTRRGRGQAMTEFALVAPIFFLLVFSIIELGLLFGGHNGLVAAARELARYSAPFHVKTNVDANNVCADTRLGTQLTNAMRISIPGFNSTFAATRQVVYSWLANPNGTYYVQLQIHVTYKFPLHVPLVGRILDGIDGTVDNRMLLDATEQMRIENEDLINSYGSVTCNI